MCNIYFTINIWYSDKSKEMVSLKTINLMQDSDLRYKQTYKLFIKTVGLLYLTSVSAEILNNVIYHLRITILHWKWM